MAPPPTRRPSAATVAAALSPVAARTLVKRSALVHLAFVVVVATGLLWWAAATGAVARALPFVAPLVVGEALAAISQQLDRPRAATILSLAGAGIATVALTYLSEAALALSPWALFFGGAAALGELTCARIADEAVAWRRAPHELVGAGLDRVLFVPRAAVLALLGRTEGEDDA